MIKVWADGTEAGLIDRHGRRGSAFAYLPDVSSERAVSVTMPVRLASWNLEFGLTPIFEMNLPEGVLRERLRLVFAKAVGTFYRRDHPEFGEVGERMIQQWDVGMQQSLKDS